MDDDEPQIVEQATDPTEVQALSRWDRWMERRSAVGCLLVLFVLLMTVLVWGWVTFR